MEPHLIEEPPAALAGHNKLIDPSDNFFPLDSWSPYLIDCASYFLILKFPGLILRCCFMSTWFFRDHRRMTTTQEEVARQGRLGGSASAGALLSPLQALFSPPHFQSIPDCVPCSPEFLTSTVFSACSSVPVRSSRHISKPPREGWLQSTVTRGKRAKLQSSPACATTQAHSFSVALASGQSLSLLLDCTAAVPPQVLRSFLRACSTPTCSFSDDALRWGRGMRQRSGSWRGVCIALGIQLAASVDWATLFEER